MDRHGPNAQRAVQPDRRRAPVPRLPQSTLGDLAIKQAKLGIEQQKLDATRAGNAAFEYRQRHHAGDHGRDGEAVVCPGAPARVADRSWTRWQPSRAATRTSSAAWTRTRQGRTLAQGGNASEISQGNFQINTATWRDFAKQAGVDINQYPNAMSAPRAVQAQGCFDDPVQPIWAAHCC